MQLNVKIICKPCRKCELISSRLQHIAQCLAFARHVKIKLDIDFTKDFKLADQYGYNVSQLPLVLINGQVAFVGHVKEESVVRAKLEEILRSQ
ncbi:MAG TPA: thioredoxin family protein [Candidatus Omnitrophota bacterium]|nr:thioredoxin family protein [Candidatus Omnitrophota bacterium]